MTDKAEKKHEIETIEVEALQPHSYNGKDYQVGDTYEIEASLADSVQTQGKAVRTDRVAHAKQVAKPVKAEKAKKGRK